MMERGAVRNLEQLQEEDPHARTPRGVTFAFVALGGACIVFAAMALSGRKSAPDAKRVDPLGDLIAQKGVREAAGATATTGQAVALPRATDLGGSEVTFPGILSDNGKPTTALAAVRGSGPLPSASAGVVTANDPLKTPAAFLAPPPPPPAADRLSVVPLPAQHVLQASPVVTRPRDMLTRAASESAQIATAAAPATGAGKEGGYQLQVSSFRTQPEAQAFADQLRARNHKAYVVEAHVPGRGTWYRVRVGPFTTLQSATAYRASFEEKEHVVPFIVQPTK